MHGHVRRIDLTCVVSSSVSAGSPPGEAAAATVAAASLTLLHLTTSGLPVLRLRSKRSAPMHGHSKSCSVCLTIQGLAQAINTSTLCAAS